MVAIRTYPAVPIRTLSGFKLSNFFRCEFKSGLKGGRFGGGFRLGLRRGLNFLFGRMRFNGQSGLNLSFGKLLVAGSSDNGLLFPANQSGISINLPNPLVDGWSEKIHGDSSGVSVAGSKSIFGNHAGIGFHMDTVVDGDQTAILVSAFRNDVQGSAFGLIASTFAIARSTFVGITLSLFSYAREYSGILVGLFGTTVESSDDSFGIRFGMINETQDAVFFKYFPLIAIDGSFKRDMVRSLSQWCSDHLPHL